MFPNVVFLAVPSVTVVVAKVLSFSLATTEQIYNPFSSSVLNGGVL